MRRRRMYILWGGLILTAITLAALFRHLREANDFYIPSTAQAQVAEALFASALTGRTAGLSRLGLQMRALAGEVQGAVTYSEAQGQCTGRGVYILRKQARSGVAVTAPHRGSDRHTGTIVQQLFAQYPFAAAAWNSAPRRRSKSCAAAGDVTREGTHYFTSFSRAFAKANPRGRIVQIHGFELTKRKEPQAQQTDFILSNGSHVPSKRLMDLANCLRLAFPEQRVAVYPIDTDELGATRNAQGQALRAMGFQGFTHIEIAAHIRLALTQDEGMRRVFAECLIRL